MKTLLAFMCILGLTAGGVGYAAASASAGETLRFKVFLDEEPIGTHSFRLQESGDGLTMESRAAFEVKLLFLTAYSYDHRSRELWREGCLAELRSHTDDNGERHSVRGQRTGEGFLIAGETERVVDDACAMTFAYWDPRILEQDRLINPQTGEVVEVEVVDEGLERLTASGREVQARRYRLSADGLDITLWYDDRRWLGLESRVGEDYLLSYRRL